MEFPQLESRPQKARRLRRQGYSLSQIAAALGMRPSGALHRWVADIPQPGWTKRPREKPEVRGHAIALRRRGFSYKEIASMVDVSLSTLSRWLREVPLQDVQRVRLKRKALLAAKRRGEALRAAGRARTRALADQAAAEIQTLGARELFVAGVVAYWAEGTKNKPWSPRGLVTFINSDPGMIQLFLAWLEMLGISKTQLTFRISIHERADVIAATRYWAEAVGIDADGFMRPTLKRHNPRTVRRNVGSQYRGCLIVKVRKSTDLNTRIEGWFSGILRNLPAGRQRAEGIAY